MCRGRHLLHFQRPFLCELEWRPGRFLGCLDMVLPVPFEMGAVLTLESLFRVPICEKHDRRP